MKSEVKFVRSTEEFIGGKNVGTGRKVMKEVIIFGAGLQGRTAAAVYKSDGVHVRCFVDNDGSKQGTEVIGIPVISPDQLLELRCDIPVVVSVGGNAKAAILGQLNQMGVKTASLFDKELLLRKERFLSYSEPTESEDLILYHVLREKKQIFWVDVGCNDPDIGSVTRAFYERGHHGINIDMESGMVRITEKERPGDVNLCVGVGREEGEAYFYSQGDWGGLSTMIVNNRRSGAAEAEKTRITTLKKICETYAGEREIAFLKIDVEGMEKDVLLGMDFGKFRPWILVIEATLPCTDIPNYEAWEGIVLTSRYHLAYVHGINRYYVADECGELDARFEPWEMLAGRYCILHADLLYAV